MKQPLGQNLVTYKVVTLHNVFFMVQQFDVII